MCIIQYFLTTNGEKMREKKNNYNENNVPSHTHVSLFQLNSCLPQEGSSH